MVQKLQDDDFSFPVYMLLKTLQSIRGKDLPERFHRASFLLDIDQNCLHHLHCSIEGRVVLVIGDVVTFQS